MNPIQSRWLTDNTHPSHDWHPDDDIMACDMCGVRTYNDEAALPCSKCPHTVSTIQGGWTGCTICGKTAADIAKEDG